MPGYKSFHPKTEVVFGASVMDRLEDYQGSRVGIVTDAFMAKSGALDRIRDRLAGSPVEVFAEAVPEPPVTAVSKGARLLGDFDPDVIVALGGGSPIDAAKAIVAILRSLRPEKTIGLVAVPTTSGTGSEVTSFAVISDPSKGLKIPLVDTDLIPDVALLDPELTRTVPPAITADTGLDVMTHAFEALVATGASDFTDALAEKALQLTFANVCRVYADGNDMVAREAMHNASCMAGMAFTAAGLGLNHGLSHSIGGRIHVPHGRINAMLMPLVIPFNSGTAEGDEIRPREAARYAMIAERIGLDAPNSRAGVKALTRHIADINRRLGIPTSLRAWGADMEAFAAMVDDLAANAIADASTSTNPRAVSHAQARALLRAVGG